MASGEARGNEEQTAHLQTALLHLLCGPRYEPLGGTPFRERVLQMQTLTAGRVTHHRSDLFTASSISRLAEINLLNQLHHRCCRTSWLDAHMPGIKATPLWSSLPTECVHSCLPLRQPPFANRTFRAIGIAILRLGHLACAPS